MTHDRTSLPSHLLTAAKSKLCKSAVLSVLALGSATAFAWNSDASVNALSCNPLNNACEFKASDQIVQTLGSQFDPSLHSKAFSVVPVSGEGVGVVVDFGLLRSAINTISREFRYRVLEILYLAEQKQVVKGYLDLSEYFVMRLALERVR